MNFHLESGISITGCSISNLHGGMAVKASH